MPARFIILHEVANMVNLLDLEFETFEEKAEEEEELASMATDRHGEVGSAINAHIYMYLQKNKIGRVFIAQTTYHFGDPTTEFEPDVSFVLLEKLPVTTGNELYFAPDLAVEIISPSDKWEDVLNKVLGYQSGGTKLVWVVALFSKQVYVFQLNRKLSFATLDVGAVLKGEDVLPNFELPVQSLFDYPDPEYQKPKRKIKKVSE
jgi:Uma2 family endonuclease